jgi:hypothetical protein
VTVYLPLSPTRYLMIEESDLPSDYYESKPLFPEGANYRTWTNAERFLISSVPSDDVLRGILKIDDIATQMRRESAPATGWLFRLWNRVRRGRQAAMRQ